MCTKQIQIYSIYSRLQSLLIKYSGLAKKSVVFFFCMMALVVLSCL